MTPHPPCCPSAGTVGAVLARPSARQRAVLTALAAAVLLSGCVASGQEASPDNPGGAVIYREPDPSGLLGSVLQEPYEMPDATLTATDGSSFNLRADTDARVTLLFFGYTHCPDVCNTVLANLASALRRTTPEVREQAQVVFVTTDPARDTPEVIREYLDRFDPSFVGLTGELPVVRRAATAVGVPLEGRQPLAGGGYEVGHGTQVLGFQDAGGEKSETARVIWSTGTPVDDLVHDVELLAAQA